MIISPPFLPASIAGESDEAFLDRAMVGGIPGDGGFPLSFDLNWHGGIHLTAPQEAGAPLPVRAIADGTVVYFRKPTEESSNPEHPLHYMDGWTDDGCIVLKHETEIGEGDNAKVVYYSIYMHLSKINLANPSVGQVVYRKDSIGEAGKIYGKAGRIHFEIIADQTQIANLTGRTTRELDYQSGNGRTDSCWGDMYFFVPPELLAYSAPPTNRTQAENTSAVAYRRPAMPAATMQEGATSTGSAPAQVTPDGYEWAVASQLQHGIFVRMSYEKGQCKLTSYYLSGDVIGMQEEEADFEYNLYSKASTLYPQSPSAGYELLRFGRVLGPDILRPTDAAHWRQIKVPGKSGEESRGAWVNLNALTVTKFSDADFPHWQGWYLVDDDTDKDSHCQSAFIRNLLNLDEGKVVADNGDAVSIATSPAYDALSPDEQKKLSERYVRERTLNMSRLTSSETQSRIRRLVCKFPTEWSANDFDDRYGWLQKVAEGEPLTPESYKRLKNHQKALSFWEDSKIESIDKKHWHINPKDFIRTYSKCGWLSSEELSRLLRQAPTAGRQRAEVLRVQMNKMLSKYLISSSRLRASHFFSQVGIETGWWQYREELGNERYFRTMYEVITPTEAGEDYDRAVSLQRNLPSGRRPVELPNPGPHPRPTINRTNYMATRPGQIAQKAAGMENGASNAVHGGQVGDGNRFHGRGFLQITGRRNYKSYEKYRGRDFTSDPNPTLLSSDDYNACDASGFFWAREKISKIADKGASPETSRKVGSKINLGHSNGTPNHNEQRQQAFTNLWKELNDKE